MLVLYKEGLLIKKAIEKTFLRALWGAGGVEPPQQGLATGAPPKKAFS